MSALDDRLVSEQVRRPRQLDLYEPAPSHWHYAQPADEALAVLDRMRELPAPPAPSFPTGWGDSPHGITVPLCCCQERGWLYCPIEAHYLGGLLTEQRQVREAYLRAKARQDVQWAAFGSVTVVAILAVGLMLAGRAGGLW